MQCAIRPPSNSCPAHHRNATASCSYTVRLPRSSYLLAQQRRSTVSVRAASTLYETLGVSQGATDRDIKRAYRQKALKLHPDVNKAPSAQAQFLEVKNAFQVLSDPQQRAQYDRKLRGGFGDFGSWGDFRNWGGRARPKQPEEDFYGLGELLSELGGSVGGWVQQQQQELSKLQQGLGEVLQQAGGKIKIRNIDDFFRDLEKEVDSWSKQRTSSGNPASLWEELAAIGEEFVDFLESGLKDEKPGGAGKEGSSDGGSSSFNRAADGGTSSSSGRSRSPVDAYEELKRAYNLSSEDGRTPTSNASSSSDSRNTTGSSTYRSGSTGNGRGSADSGSGSTSSTAGAGTKPPPKKNTDEDIDEMLAALKKKLNKA
eukprot:GHRR01010716.1.p1 GENE.GHRR01010716.1~~GHRR01010716.1.p1  ORF type:complete len:371 (+),score=162.54 GHRR01010716.1:106-1218(+)